MSIVFAKAGRSNLTFERGRIVPYSTVEYTINQQLDLTESNNPKVTDYGDDLQLMKLTFNHLSKDMYNGTVNGLETWFSSSQINWAVNNFTMTDEGGTAHTVRLWQKGFALSKDQGNRYSLSIILLKE